MKVFILACNDDFDSQHIAICATLERAKAEAQKHSASFEQELLKPFSTLLSWEKRYDGNWTAEADFNTMFDAYDTSYRIQEAEVLA